MNLIFKLFLSMSFSGALLILALLLGKPFLKDKISWQWQYYIWLVVILRLLIPFGPETNLMGRTYQAVDQAIARSAPFSRQQTLFLDPKDAPYVGFEPDSEDADQPAEALTTAYSFPDSVSPLVRSLRLIWLLVALGMLIRKITVYQSFLRYIHAGLTPVSDLKVLDRLSAAAEQAGIKKPVELCIHPLISSPLLTGFLHPCIVLPDLHISEKDFPYIVLHELTHWRRKDILYKWLVQLTVCLHWFNPLVHLMNREITKACEFSCDEAVLAKAGHDNAQDYGTTLLNAMAAVGKHRETPGTVTLSENKQLLKERICAVMNVRQPSKAAKTGTFILTLCVVFAAAFVGVYTMGTAALSLLHLIAWSKQKTLPLLHLIARSKQQTLSQKWNGTMRKTACRCLELLSPGWMKAHKRNGWKSSMRTTRLLSSLSLWADLIRPLLCLPTLRKKHMQRKKLHFSPPWRTAWTKQNWNPGWTGH